MHAGAGAVPSTGRDGRAHWMPFVPVAFEHTDFPRAFRNAMPDSASCATAAIVNRDHLATRALALVRALDDDDDSAPSSLLSSSSALAAYGAAACAYAESWRECNARARAGGRQTTRVPLTFTWWVHVCTMQGAERCEDTSFAFESVAAETAIVMWALIALERADASAPVAARHALDALGRVTRDVLPAFRPRIALPPARERGVALHALLTSDAARPLPNVDARPREPALFSLTVHGALEQAVRAEQSLMEAAAAATDGSDSHEQCARLALLAEAHLEVCAQQCPSFAAYANQRAHAARARAYEAVARALTASGDDDDRHAGVAIACAQLAARHASVASGPRVDALVALLRTLEQRNEVVRARVPEHVHLVDVPCGERISVQDATHDDNDDDDDAEAAHVAHVHVPVGVEIAEDVHAV